MFYVNLHKSNLNAQFRQIRNLQKTLRFSVRLIYSWKRNSKTGAFTVFGFKTDIAT